MIPQDAQIESHPFIKIYTDPDNPPHPSWRWIEGYGWQPPRLAPIVYTTMNQGQTSELPESVPHYYPIKNLPIKNGGVRVVYVPSNPVPLPTPTTTPATPATPEENLIFGYPAMYVYVGGAALLVAAYVAYSMMSKK